MHLMYYAGANSLGGSAWRTKAAFDAIQMPGMGDRWVSKTARKNHIRNFLKKKRKH